MFITLSGAVAVGNLETLNVQPQVKTYTANATERYIHVSDGHMEGRCLGTL